MSLLRSIFTLFFILFVVAFGFGQQHSDYHLFGIVKDTKGNPIPDAKITLKNKENGREIVIKVKSDGTFDQQFIPHAVYSMSVDKQGYSSRKVDTVDLSAVAETTINRKIDIVLVTPQEEQEVKASEQQAAMAKEVQEQYKKGVDEYTAKQFDQAIATMKEVVAKEPNSFGPYLVMGAAYQAKGDCDNAIVHLEKTVSIKNDIAEAHRGLADCYTAKKNYSKAIEAYKALLAQTPTDAESRCVLANIHLAQDKTADAQTELTKAMQDNPNAGLCYKVSGELLLKKGDMKGAARDLKKYIELQPDAADKAQVEEMIKALEQSK